VHPAGHLVPDYGGRVVTRVPPRAVRSAASTPGQTAACRARYSSRRSGRSLMVWATRFMPGPFVLRARGRRRGSPGRYGPRSRARWRRRLCRERGADESSQASYCVVRVITGQSLPHRHRSGPKMFRTSHSVETMSEYAVPGAVSVARPESLHTTLSCRAGRRIACRHVTLPGPGAAGDRLGMRVDEVTEDGVCASTSGTLPLGRHHRRQPGTDALSPLGGPR
jgi:hypothetical protein